MEFFIDNACWGAVRQLTVNGVPVPPSYARYTWNGSPYSVFKATRLNMQKPQVGCWVAVAVLVCCGVSWGMSVAQCSAGRWQGHQHHHHPSPHISLT